MVTKSWINLMTILFLAAILAGALPDLTAAQNCGCGPDLCCSRFGWCGSTEDYCGPGCQEGPCFPPAEPTNVSVASIVTQDFFDSIIRVADPSCPGKNFYSQSVFLQALDLYPLFGREGSIDDSKREIAAFFAHVTHETGHMCHIEEIDGASRDYCQKTNTQYPCFSGVGYYGRGPLQLSWNYNYGPAGHEIGFNGLQHPEIVATDNIISFKASLWFWMMNVHSIIVSGDGFGETIRAINGNLECNGANPATVHARVQYFTAYCNYYGTSPGVNLYC